jgi:menaquinone-dependent protoporphyrinogen oxidase
MPNTVRVVKVLVTASGRYGSTQEIAESIGRSLLRHGHDVSVIPSPDVDEVAGFDAIVMGGAVYAGQWLRDGRELIKRTHQALTELPLWVFSSGPVGDMRPEPPPLMVDILEPLRPVDHAVFGGKLIRSQLFLGDRAVAQSLGAPDGDYRDWAVIDAWAEKVATELGD